jgi:hypothetical protein
MVKVTFLVALLAVSALAQTSATIIFYQVKNAVAYNQHPAAAAYVDEAQVATVRDKRFCSIRVEPGKHAVRSKTKLEAVSLSVEAGKTYYVRILEHQEFMHLSYTPVVVDAEQGKRDVAELKPADPKDVVASSRQPD